MALFLADLHSFIIYSYVGTAIILALAYILFEVLRTSSSKLKSQVYFSALIVPPVSYVILHVLLRKPCGILPWNLEGRIAEIYNAICSIGAKAIDILVPLFGVAFIIGILKGIISIIACRRLITKYGFVNRDEAPELFEVLHIVAEQIGIEVPKLIIVPNEKSKAFTFGIRQPVVVISDGILQQLAGEDIEHILKHECAHIKRDDVLTNWLAVMIRDMSFFNPFTHWAFSAYVAAKEEASDDLAIQTGLNPYEYGTTLIKMWRNSKENTLTNVLFNNISPNPGFLKKAAAFEKRVSRMLAWEENTNEVKFFKVYFSVILLFSVMILAFVC